MTQLVKLDSKALYPKLKTAFDNATDIKEKFRDKKRKELLEYEKNLDAYNKLSFFKRLLTFEPMHPCEIRFTPAPRNIRDSRKLQDIKKLCQKGDSVYLDYEAVALIEEYLGENL